MKKAFLVFICLLGIAAGANQPEGCETQLVTELRRLTGEGLKNREAEMKRMFETELVPLLRQIATLGWSQAFLQRASSNSNATFMHKETVTIYLLKDMIIGNQLNELGKDLLRYCRQNGLNLYYRRVWDSGTQVEWSDFAENGVLQKIPDMEPVPTMEPPRREESYLVIGWAKP